MTIGDIGFIGLGAMGYPMAARIAAAGHRLGPGRDHTELARAIELREAVELRAG